MIKEVVVSREAVEDLEEGRAFYERSSLVKDSPCNLIDLFPLTS